jgi:hypothetical protein
MGMGLFKLLVAIGVAISVFIALGGGVVGGIVGGLVLIGDASYSYASYIRSKEVAEGKREKMWPWSEPPL